MSELMREEFEARFPVPSGVAWSDEHQNYGWVKKSAFQKTITYRALFTGWKASRESLVIPQFMGYSFEGFQYYDADAVDDALSDLGLKMTP